MLLCLSSVHGRSVLEEPVEAAGEVAFEAAVCFSACFAFADPSFDVRDRGFVDSAAGDEDLVHRSVELSVAAAVESVADRLSGGGGDRGDAGEPGERGLASNPAFVGPGEHDLGREERPNAGLVEELWRELLGQGLDLAGELVLLDD